MKDSLLKSGQGKVDMALKLEIYKIHKKLILNLNFKLKLNMKANLNLFVNSNLNLKLTVEFSVISTFQIFPIM